MNFVLAALLVLAICAIGKALDNLTGEVKALREAYEEVHK